MEHESRSVKEGSHDRQVRDDSLARPEMKRATRTTLEAWGGTGLVVIASVMMKVSTYSALRTVVFVVVMLIAMGLIIRSLGGGSRDEEE
jgi:hypothetical protein